MSAAEKAACDVIMVTDIRISFLALYKFVTADLALRSIIIFYLLAGTETLHCTIRRNNRHELLMPHDKRVKKLGQRNFSDFDHSLFVKVIQARGVVTISLTVVIKLKCF